MDFDALVLRDGDRVTATGLLIRNDQGDWLQPHLPIALPGRAERRVSPVGRGAVRITGADFATLANRVEQDGAVEGSATVTGVWSGDQLRGLAGAFPGRPLVCKRGEREHESERVRAARASRRPGSIPRVHNCC